MLFSLLVAALVPLANALGQKQIISFEQSDSGDSFQLAGKGSGAGQILVSDNDYWGVIRAAGDLAVDFGRVTGKNLTLSNGEKGAEPAEFDFEPVNVKNNTDVGLMFCPVWWPRLMCSVLDDWGGKLQRPQVLQPGCLQNGHYCGYHWALDSDRQARQGGKD